MTAQFVNENVDIYGWPLILFSCVSLSTEVQFVNENVDIYGWLLILFNCLSLSTEVQCECRQVISEDGVGCLPLPDIVIDIRSVVHGFVTHKYILLQHEQSILESELY